MIIDKTKKAKVTEWLNGYMSDCDNDNAYSDCLCQNLCRALDDCAPRAIKEIIEQQRAEIKQIELRVLKNFIRKMSKAYRERTHNWVAVRDILMWGTNTAGMTSCLGKCLELGIDPYGYTFEMGEING